MRFAAAVAAGLLLTTTAPAVAQPDAPAPPPPGCPDVQVLFARGTTEPPGLGAVGDAFVDDLKSRVAPKLSLIHI